MNVRTEKMMLGTSRLMTKKNGLRRRCKLNVNLTYGVSQQAYFT